MIRLLLIANDSEPAQGARAPASLDGDFAITRRERASEVESAISAGAFDLCLIEARSVDPRLIARVAEARALHASLPLVLLLETAVDAAAQSRLFSAGADNVLFAPLDPALLDSMLRRLALRQASVEIIAASPATPPHHAKAAGLSSGLEVLRDFSQVLGDSLDHRRLAHHFVVKLREVVGVARAVIFLETGEEQGPLATGRSDSSRLTCAAAAGLPADLAECFSLTRLSGLGRRLSHRPEILRAATVSTPGTPGFDSKIARELEVLGGEIAIPVHDRERMIGVAVLGGRITGGAFEDQELLLVYHLLEQLGLAVKNSRLHRQLVEGHRLVGQVLEGLTIGAAAIGSDQSVVYANRAIVRFLAGEHADRLSIHDLPPPIAGRVHELVENGAETAPFFHETDAPARRCYRVSLVPLHRAETGPARMALLLLEDFTPVIAAQRAEIEASNLKLVSLIARRFAHEIRNSLVPLTTHAQLFDAEIGDPAFRGSLKGALRDETRRILRFTEQMLLLANPERGEKERVPLDELLRSSFEKSLETIDAAGEIEIERLDRALSVLGHRASLGHAFLEIFLNGLQAGENTRRLFVSIAENTPAGLVEIRVRDNGGGFAPTTAGRATEAFFTTRNTGVGLGLTIARRVIEAHSGSLEVHERRSSANHDLTIRLPISR